MAAVVVWSEQAAADLAAIAEYLDTRSAVAASKVVQAVSAALSRAAEMPMSMGRMVPEFGDPCRRETFVFEYRVMYRVEADHVVALRVVHGRRLLTNVSGSFEESAQVEYAAS